MNAAKNRAAEMKPIRTYAVTVRGFGPALYSARSPGKARATAFRQYQSYDDRVTFADFLKMSGVRLENDPPGFGFRVKIGGRPATRVVNGDRSLRNRSLLFMYDDSDVIISAHGMEVEWFPCGTI